MVLAAPEPHVIVLFGATGDLARRKLLPGLLHLSMAGLMPPEFRIVGTSLDEHDDEGFRVFARSACDDFARHRFDEEQWRDFARRLTRSQRCSSRRARLPDRHPSSRARRGRDRHGMAARHASCTAFSRDRSSAGGCPATISWSTAR